MRWECFLLTNPGVKSTGDSKKRREFDGVGPQAELSPQLSCRSPAALAVTATRSKMAYELFPSGGEEVCGICKLKISAQIASAAARLHSFHFWSTAGANLSPIRVFAALRPSRGQPHQQHRRE